MSQRARSSGSKGSTGSKGSKGSKDSTGSNGLKGPLPSFPKSQPMSSSGSTHSGQPSQLDEPVELSRFYEVKEPVDRIYDESERCFDKMRMLHGTNVPHGKIIIWEVKGTPRISSGVSSEDPSEKTRSPLFKIKVVNGQRHGRYREYYPNGQRKFETYFQMNQETGPRHNWSEQGQDQVQVR